MGFICTLKLLAPAQTPRALVARNILTLGKDGAPPRLPAFTKTKRATDWWPSAYFTLRLLARAVGAAAAGGIAGGAGIAAAVTVVIGHVIDPFFFWWVRVGVEKRGCFAAPRQISVPGLTDRGCASTRRCSGCTGWSGYRDRIWDRRSWGLLSMAGSGIRLSGRGECRRGFRGG